MWDMHKKPEKSAHFFVDESKKCLYYVNDCYFELLCHEIILGQVQILKRKAAFRKKKNTGIGVMLLIGFSMILFAATIMTGVSKEKEKLELLTRQESELEQKLQEQEKYAQELEQFRKYTKTKKYAEEVAKEKLGLVYSDEIVFRPDSN